MIGHDSPVKKTPGSLFERIVVQMVFKEYEKEQCFQHFLGL